MSLGPPFDESGRALRRIAGPVVVATLGAAVAWVLVMSDRAVGPGISVRVGLGTMGALHVGDKVRLAGHEVGEVRSAVRRDDRVELNVFVSRRWAGELRDNSQLFVATPSLLGEAYLEIGLPARGAAPGAPVADGALLIAVDPPELDKLLVRSEESVRRAVALLHEQRPALDELLRAGDELLATLSGLPADRGQLARIAAQAARGLDDGAVLLHALQQSDAVARTRAVARDLGEVADRAAPELRALADKLDRAATRLDGLAALFDGAERARLAAALAAARRATRTAAAVVAEARALAAAVARGQGTLGGLLNDRELFDDLHETHRIIKSQPWTFILKPITKDKRRPTDTQRPR